MLFYYLFSLRSFYLDVIGNDLLKQIPDGCDYFIDNFFLFGISRHYQTLSGRNSAVECHLAKVDVDGSNPFARSIFLSEGRHSQVVRQRSAKPLFPGSSPGAASSVRE